MPRQAPAVRAEVAVAFEGFDAPAREVLLSVRNLIFAVAWELPEAGGVREYLAWGQPSYRPVRDGVGTAVRLGEHGTRMPALFVHCRTSLIEDFRRVTNTLEFSGGRAVLLDPVRPLPVAELRVVIEIALGYRGRRST